MIKLKRLTWQIFRIRIIKIHARFFGITLQCLLLEFGFKSFLEALQISKKSKSQIKIEYVVFVY